MSVTALAPWYGSNRLLAEHVGRALDGCSWVGVPFAGGMSELAHIKARTMLVSDLHSHVINLARVVADRELRLLLRERMDSSAFHPEILAESQRRCQLREIGGGPKGDMPILEWAVDYFRCAWMTRSGSAGTPAEFRGALSVRWEAGGGDSVVRFRSAADALESWGQVCCRCTFVMLDVFEFLEKVKDAKGHGLYLDPPFPGPGDRYTHRFGDEQQRRLATRLAQFSACRVVCRFYDVPLIRELYPEPEWTWTHLVGKKQTGESAPEVLLTRNGA